MGKQNKTIQAKGRKANITEASKEMLASQLMLLFTISLREIVLRADLLVANAIESKEGKILKKDSKNIEVFYEAKRSETDLLGQHWQYVTLSLPTILLFEFTREINEWLKIDSYGEELFTVLSWLEKSPSRVNISLVQEWSLTDFNNEANKTVIVRLIDKKKRSVVEKRITFWMVNVQKLIEFMAWDNQLKILRGKIGSQPNQKGTTINYAEITGAEKEEESNGASLNVGVSKWNAESDLLVKIFTVLTEKLVTGKQAIVTSEQNLKTVINQNFVNEEGKPLLGTEVNQTYSKIDIHCKVKALAELFLYLTHEKVDGTNKKSPTYLSGHRESVKRILNNCFNLKTGEDTLRKYIQDFEDSVENDSLDVTVKKFRKQKRKQNFIPLIQEVFLSK